MEKNTPYLLMLMAGLLVGRLLSSQHLKIVEITGQLFLAFCHRGDLLDGLRRLAIRPHIRAYVVPRYAKAHHGVAAFGVVKTRCLRGRHPLWRAFARPRCVAPRCTLSQTATVCK